jgi:hypothetical protein
MNFMKTNGTRILAIAVFLYLLLLIASFSIQAQPDYRFKNPTLISGTDLTAGAKYRFDNVKPNVDGILTIVAMSGDMTLAELDGASGFDDAFQPYINCAPKKKGYVEFLLEFVNKSGSLVNQLEVPLTAIDIDGWEFPDEKLYELDEFEVSPAYYVNYDLLGNALSIKRSGDWYEVKNTSAITYDGIDTLQKDVMFTMVHANVSSVRFRVGADNKSKQSMMRLRSVYFKKFTYNNSFLATSPLLFFRGNEKNKKVELQWQLENTAGLRSVVIEKSGQSSPFKSIGEVWISNNAGSKYFRFVDNETLSGNSLYRLRLVSQNGVVEYSNILSFRDNFASQNSFKVYPSVIGSNATVTVKALKQGIAVFEMVDLSGRLVHRQQLVVNEGNNSIQLNNINTLTAGNYMAVVKIDNAVYSRQVLKQ